MKLSECEHTSRPWRIHQLAPDFAVEDVWTLPTPGKPGELPRLVRVMFGVSFPSEANLVARFLWQARWKLGALLGWDDKAGGIGRRVASLRQRLPEDLRVESWDPEIDMTPFSPVYQLAEEFAAELANRTVHTLMHLSWVADGAGGYRGQMAVLVKPNGRLGTLYLAAIAPLRHYIVYPALFRQIERRWRASAGEAYRSSSSIRR